MLSFGLVGVAPADRAFAQSALPKTAAPSATSAFETARFSVVVGAGGVPLNVVEVGDPSLPAILLIHGFRQSYLSWTYQFGSNLSEHCHIVAFDLRGHGNSGAPWQPGAYDHAQPWADDVAAVIRATGLTRPLVVGWSYGGTVAMDFARLHPEIPVTGYVLVSTTAGMVPMPTPPTGSPPRPTATPNLEANIAAVESSADLLFPARIDPALRKRFLAAAMRVSPFVDRAIVARAGEVNTEVVASIHSPIILVFGGKDPIISPAMVQRMAVGLPTAKVVNFPNAGHGLFIEEPARFNTLLEDAQCARP